MQQILLNGISLDELLTRIGSMMDERIGKAPETENPTNEFMSRLEVAKLLHVSLPTLHEWTKSGRIPKHKIGSRVLYKKDEILAAIDVLQQQKNKKGGGYEIAE